MKSINKSLIFTVLVTFSLLMLSSCEEFEGEGENVIVNKSVSDFSKIAINLPCQVYIEYDSVQSLSIDGQSNMIDNMNIEVLSNKLRIAFEREVDNYNPITLRITMPELRELQANDDNVISISSNTTMGSNLRIEATGNVSIDITDTTRCLNFYYEGSGTSTLNYDYLVCEDFNYKVTGIDESTIKGECLKSTITVEGESTFEGFGLISASTTLDISGTSNTTNVYATEELNANVDGNATVRYKGNPTTVDYSDSSGNLDIAAAE